MTIKKKSAAFRLVTLLLTLVLALPLSANAAAPSTVQPCASDYLDSYNGYIYPADNGLIQVWFTVTGTRTMAHIGCMTIQLYESSDASNWEWVKVYSHTKIADMMTTNEFFYMGHVEYEGTPGKYYRAYICIFAGEGANGDSRYFYTSAKRAS